MPDKNFLSFEDQRGQIFARTPDTTVVPPSPDYNDTVKVFRCNECTFDTFHVVGGTEDVLDVGRESSGNYFRDWVVQPRGQYVATIKGGSHDNVFYRWTIHGHGTDVDFEFGNWHSLNFERSTGNSIWLCATGDGSPVTYAYRWGCKPRIIDTHARHIWWRSIGLTVYWWAKYFAHRVLRLPDNF